MKRWRHFTGSLAAAVILTGCTLGEPCGTPAEKAVFRNVAARIDSDGSEYFVLNGASAAKSFERALNNYEAGIWQNQTLAGDRKRQLQKYVTMCRMIAVLAGIDRLDGVGFSAKTLTEPEFGRNFIHSKLFLALKPEHPVVLNNLFLRDDTFSCGEMLAELPADTLFFAAVSFSPEALLQALRISGTWGENNALNIMEKFPLQEIAAGLRGIWSWAATDDGEFLSALTFPDKSGDIRRICQSDSGIFPNAEVEYAEKAIRIYSSAAAKKYFTGKGKKMRDRSDFKTLLRAMPEKGFLCCYLSENFFIEKDLLGWMPVEKNIPPLPSVSAATHLPDGILLTANGAGGVLDFLLRLCNIAAAFTESAPETAGTAPDTKPEQPEPKCDCEVLMSVIRCFPALPSAAGVAGLRACFEGVLPEKYLFDAKAPAEIKNCRVIYFGKGDANMPLALSSPAVHQDRFHVLFNDMTFQTFKLERVDSCRRMIGFLHTVKRYDENVLRQLMVQAQKFDLELNRNIVGEK